MRTVRRPCEILFLLLLATSARAQVVEAKNCGYHQGDDPSWARPEYDDSRWSKDGAGPLFLQLRSGFAWRAWVNGIPAGEFGNSDTGALTTAYVRQRPLPVGASDSRSLGIRLPGLTLKRAREIAVEAERRGQEDDITVVQVAYA